MVRRYVSKAAVQQALIEQRPSGMDELGGIRRTGEPNGLARPRNQDRRLRVIG
jgi:hypothetical protein